MSYDIYIGQAELETFEEDLTAQYTVRRLEHPDAPTFPGDGITGNGNSRHPGYSAWSRFCEMTGLDGLFFEKWAGLMCQHPGIMRLTPEHLGLVDEALRQWRERYPNAVPRFSSSPYDKVQLPESTEEDGALARLIWLQWWMKYALESCSIPAIHNH